MTWTEHDHRGAIMGLRDDLDHATRRIRDLEHGLASALDRIRDLEALQAPPGNGDPDPDTERLLAAGLAEDRRYAEEQQDRWEATDPGYNPDTVDDEDGDRHLADACPDCGRAECTGEDCYWPDDAGITRPQRDPGYNPDTAADDWRAEDHARDLAREDGDYDDCEPTL